MIFHVFQNQFCITSEHRRRRFCHWGLCEVNAVIHVWGTQISWQIHYFCLANQVKIVHNGLLDFSHLRSSTFRGSQLLIVVSDRKGSRGTCTIWESMQRWQAKKLSPVRMFRNVVECSKTVHIWWVLFKISKFCVSGGSFGPNYSTFSMTFYAAHST